MELDDWQKSEIKVYKAHNEHYVPYVPNELEKMAINATKQHKTYGQLQQEETIRKMREEKARQERKHKKF